MPRTRCVAEGCQNNRYRLRQWQCLPCPVHGDGRRQGVCDCEPPFRLLCFPSKRSDPELRELWVRAVNRTDEETGDMWEPGPNDRLCSKHFEPEAPYPTIDMGDDVAPLPLPITTPVSSNTEAPREQTAENSTDLRPVALYKNIKVSPTISMNCDKEQTEGKASSIKQAMLGSKGHMTCSKSIYVVTNTPAESVQSDNSSNHIGNIQSICPTSSGGQHPSKGQKTFFVIPSSSSNGTGNPGNANTNAACSGGNSIAVIPESGSNPEIVVPSTKGSEGNSIAVIPASNGNPGNVLLTCTKGSEGNSIAVIPASNGNPGNVLPITKGSEGNSIAVIPVPGCKPNVDGNVASGIALIPASGGNASTRSLSCLNPGIKSSLNGNPNVNTPSKGITPPSKSAGCVTSLAVSSSGFSHTSGIQGNRNVPIIVMPYPEGSASRCSWLGKRYIKITPNGTRVIYRGRNSPNAATTTGSKVVFNPSTSSDKVPSTVFGDGTSRYYFPKTEPKGLLQPKSLVDPPFLETLSSPKGCGMDKRRQTVIGSNKSVFLMNNDPRLFGKTSGLTSPDGCDLSGNIGSAAVGNLADVTLPSAAGSNVVDSVKAVPLSGAERPAVKTQSSLSEHRVVPTSAPISNKAVANDTFSPGESKVVSVSTTIADTFPAGVDTTVPTSAPISKKAVGANTSGADHNHINANFAPIFDRVVATESMSSENLDPISFTKFGPEAYPVVPTSAPISNKAVGSDAAGAGSNHINANSAPSFNNRVVATESMASESLDPISSMTGKKAVSADNYVSGAYPVLPTSAPISNKAVAVDTLGTGGNIPTSSTVGNIAVAIATSCKGNITEVLIGSTTIDACSSGGNREVRLSAGDNRTVPLSAGDNRVFPLSAGDIRAVPLSAGDNREVPLSAGDNRVIPLSARDNRVVPLSAGDNRVVPLSAGDNRVVPLSAGDNRVVPLSAGENRAVPLSAGDNRALLLSAGENRVVPLSAGDNRVVPLSAGDNRVVPLSAGDNRAVPLSDPFSNKAAASDTMVAKGNVVALILDPIGNIAVNSDTLDNNISQTSALDDNIAVVTGTKSSTGHSNVLPISDPTCNATVASDTFGTDGNSVGKDLSSGSKMAETKTETTKCPTSRGEDTASVQQRTYLGTPVGEVLKISAEKNNGDPVADRRISKDDSSAEHGTIKRSSNVDSQGSSVQASKKKKLCYNNSENKDAEESPAVAETVIIPQHDNTKRGKGRHICKLCFKQFSAKAKLRKHMGGHRNIPRQNNLRCGMCNVTLPNKAKLSAHFSGVHSVSEPLKCNMCRHSFDNQTSLGQHWQCGDLQANTCERCGEGFGVRCRFLNHVWTHTESRPFSCSFCKKSFKTKPTLKSHKRRHQNKMETPALCKKCLCVFIQTVGGDPHEC